MTVKKRADWEPDALSLPMLLQQYCSCARVWVTRQESGGKWGSRKGKYHCLVKGHGVSTYAVRRGISHKIDKLTVILFESIQLHGHLWKDAETSSRVTVEGKWCNPAVSLDTPVSLWAAAISTIVSCTGRAREDVLKDEYLDLPRSTFSILPCGCHMYFWTVYHRTSLCHSSEWGMY